MADKPQVVTGSASISNEYTTPGTLGGFAKLVTGNTVVAVSNAHVMFGGATQATTRLAIYTPEYGSSCCRGTLIANTYGSWSGGFRPATTISDHASGPGTETQSGMETDVAVAGVTGLCLWSNQVPLLGRLGKTTKAIADVMGVAAFGTGPDKHQPTSIPADATILRFYSPMAKRIKYGVVLAQSLNAKDASSGVALPPQIFPKRATLADGNTNTQPQINQFFVLPIDPPGSAKVSPPGTLVWCQPGDSGSLVVTGADNAIVGLVVAGVPFLVATPSDPAWLQAVAMGTDPEMGGMPGAGIVNPIESVMAQLKAKGLEISFDLDDAPAQAAGAMVAVPADREELAFQRGRERVVAVMRASRLGRVILAKLRQHGREARQLVARDRRAQLAWHRHQGAAFVQHYFANLRDPRHLVPDSINGVTRAEALAAMAEVLAAGSPTLRRDVARYRAMVLRHAPRLDTLERAGEVIADAWREQTTP